MEEEIEERIMNVLKLQRAGTAEEIAFTIAELQGIATEEGVAETVVAVKEQVKRLTMDARLEEIRSKHSSKRYKLAEH